MNPKDPPSIELCALLDTGANCNVISKRYEHLFNISDNSKRRIRFATESNSQLASLCNLSLSRRCTFFTCESNINKPDTTLVSPSRLFASVTALPPYTSLCFSSISRHSLPSCLLSFPFDERASAMDCLGLKCRTRFLGGHCELRRVI